VSRTASPVHVNIASSTNLLVTDSFQTPSVRRCQLLVGCWLHHLWSTGRLIWFYLGWRDTTQGVECSFDSDWILRTLSPSNESSKDLNLQRINMIFIVPRWTAIFSELSVQKWTVSSDSNGD